MQFELTNALIDDILFAMEDQIGEFMLDTVEGVVAGGVDGQGFSNDDDGGPRYITLPEWDSSSGFRLMERFTVWLRNPVVREELSSALGLGKGVFRAFKNTLACHPEAEKLWYSYKDKEMKKEIFKWYNGLREEWGLERIGVEPEDTDDLILEDFCFRPFREDDVFPAEELHRQCLEEIKDTLTGTGSGFSLDGILGEIQSLSGIQYLYRSGIQYPSDKSFGNGMVAESRGGELAGYISGEKKESVFYIQNLEVKAAFRGLGIGEALLVKFLDSLDPAEIDQVLFDLPSWAESFSRVLRRESFNPYMVRYWLKLRDRAE